MATMYYEKDCDRKFLEGKKIAVIGYGSQGHAHALNLRDSGFDVTIGLYEGSKSAEAAKKAGLPVMLTRDAVAACDVVMVLVNDEKQAALYKNDIAPALKRTRNAYQPKERGNRIRSARNRIHAKLV